MKEENGVTEVVTVGNAQNPSMSPVEGVEAVRDLRVWTCSDHDGHYPVGAASVVVASNETDAIALLATELASRKLSPLSFTVQEVDLTKPSVTVLCDGDY